MLDPGRQENVPGSWPLLLHDSGEQFLQGIIYG
jgi:hypothetical protein